MVTEAELILAARQVAARAYSPYSKYCVGAAVLFEDADGLFTGCNVENASYGLTICAERVAICAGIAAGFRRIEKLAVALLNNNGVPQPSFMPCGACLQFMQEFGAPDTDIIVAGVGTFKLSDLLPRPF